MGVACPHSSLMSPWSRRVPATFTCPPGPLEFAQPLCGTCGSPGPFWVPTGPHKVPIARTCPHGLPHVPTALRVPTAHTDPHDFCGSHRSSHAPAAPTCPYSPDTSPWLPRVRSTRSRSHSHGPLCPHSPQASSQSLWTPCVPTCPPQCFGPGTWQPRHLCLAPLGAPAHASKAHSEKVVVYGFCLFSRKKKSHLNRN